MGYNEVVIGKGFRRTAPRLYADGTPKRNLPCPACGCVTTHQMTCDEAKGQCPECGTWATPQAIAEAKAGRAYMKHVLAKGGTVTWDAATGVTTITPAREGASA